jgi:sugar O-acyltransferase (sialic acid O-acetyltransferase NeuD family)
VTQKCVVLGAGSHAVVVASALAAAGVEVVGFIDRDASRPDFTFGESRILGTDAVLETFVTDADLGFVCGVGGTANNALRRSVFLRAKSAGLRGMVVVHPGAHVDPSVRLGEGSFIGVGAIVNVGSVLGMNVIVNSGGIVEHHCRLGDHVHVATGAVLCGTVDVADEAHIGAGATIRQGIRIGRRSVVGAGAVVVADVMDGETVVGNPARPIDGHSRKGPSAV